MKEYCTHACPMCEAETDAANAALFETQRYLGDARADVVRARDLIRGIVAAWDHDRGAHALRCGGALVEAIGRCREAMEEWG